MYRTAIAVVDATRARLFTLDRSSDEQGLHEELLEQRDLVNLARRRRPSELFDDHRDAHIDTLDLEFAGEVMRQLVELLRSTSANRLIVCASPRMLGHLRDARRGLSLELPIAELPRDFVKLTPTEIHQHLVTHGLVQQRPPSPPRAML